MKFFPLLASCATIALLSAGSASAADLPSRVVKPSAPMIQEFNPWMVRVRALAVIPADKSTVNLNGLPFNTLSNNLAVSNSVVPELDISYFFNRNFAVELILGTTPHNIKTANALRAAVPGKVGSSWLLPPTLTAQYHFYLTENIKPYVGAGVNYTFFLDEKQKGSFDAFNVKNSFGLALQAGVDVMIDKHWGLNLDVKKIFLQPEYRAVVAGIQATGKAKLDPWLIGTGVTYKF